MEKVVLLARERKIELQDVAVTVCDDRAGNTIALFQNLRSDSGRLEDLERAGVNSESARLSRRTVGVINDPRLESAAGKFRSRRSCQQARRRQSGCSVAEPAPSTCHSLERNCDNH